MIRRQTMLRAAAVLVLACLARKGSGQENEFPGAQESCEGNPTSSVSGTHCCTTYYCPNNINHIYVGTSQVFYPGGCYTFDGHAGPIYWGECCSG